MTTAELREFDEILLTGTPSSGLDVRRRLVGFRCVVATLSLTTDTGDPDDPPAVKVWPHVEGAHMLTPHERYHGKLWFAVADIESLELVRRVEDEPAEVSP